jgi:hypothetical protein
MKKKGFSKYLKSILPFFALSTLHLWCFLPGCSREHSIRDIRGYYFPLEKLEAGSVYEYASEGNVGTEVAYWYYRSFLKGDKKIFSSTFYENDVAPRQHIQEEVVRNGLLLKSLFIYDLPDEKRGYKQERTDVNIVAGNTFPFEVRDSFGIFLYFIKWQSREKDAPEYRLIKNRRFMGDTIFTWKNQRIPAIYFKVREKIEVEEEGVTGQLLEGIEIYAKGIGLVYYEKELSADVTLAYRLVKQMSMEDLEKKWEQESRD